MINLCYYFLSIKYFKSPIIVKKRLLRKSICILVFFLLLMSFIRYLNLMTREAPRIIYVKFVPTFCQWQPTLHPSKALVI